MLLTDYLNQIYDSHDLLDYEYGKIDLETQDLSDSDKEVLVLILDIIRLNERYRKNEDNVFEQISSKKLPELKDVTKEDLSSLLSMDLSALPLAIRARISDYLWTTVKDPGSARIAIQSYLNLYDLLWDEDNWPDCIDAIYRAINISCRYNKKGKEYKDCIEAVVKGIERTKGNDHLFLTSSLLEILAEQKCRINDDIQGYARNAIETAKGDNNLLKAQTILEALVKLDPEKKELYYEEAGDITQALAFNPAIRRVQILNQALQYYEKAGAKEKQQKCRNLLEEAQSHIIEEMQVIKTDPIDISSTVNEICSIIGKASGFKQAIISFGNLVHINKRDELLEHIREKGGSLASLFPSATVDHRGRQMYSLPPLPLGQELNIDNEQVQLHMWDKANWLQEMNAEIVLKYALSELNRLYQYKEEDFDFLVDGNAIIPKGREKIIRKGIFLGLQGDIYAALHILIPQTENIIRNIVEACGGKTYYYETNGNIKESMLNSLLDSPELKDCYDQDVIFCLKGLLDKKEGSNLRNKIAHGFMEPGNSLIGLYFLGFVIKFLSWYSSQCMEERIKMSENKNKETNKP